MTCRLDWSGTMDTLELYRWAVQDPETHAEVLRIMYEDCNPGRRPSVLREDFAGTAADSVAWVALREGRYALAVDLDGPTIGWAKQRAARILGSRASDLEFIVADVMEVGPPQSPAADIITVLNYSIFYFRDRKTLGQYFIHAGRCLAPQGLLVLNLFGGAETMQPRTKKRPVAPAPRLPTEAAIPPFEYIWEQRSYDAASAGIDCRIHFNVPDPASPGGVCEVRDVFRYDWRLWPMEELIEELRLAGFDDVEVWRHTYDPSEGAAGLFLGPVPLSELDSLDYWTAYVVATRTAR
jgi:SAM-dependent methyltransferase